MQKSEQFPVVGIGASAGGLEALSKLLVALPSNTGMAFVVITHMAPHQKSSLASILEVKCVLPVKELKKTTKINPNTIYVIVPNTEIIIKHDFLEVCPRDIKEKLHLPINRFFDSLARNDWKQFIGVVLSGEGSDGAVGMKKIKESGGITFAQDPETTMHSSMPHHSISEGGADFVLPPEKIAEEITKLGKDKGFSLKVKHEVATSLHKDEQVHFDGILRQLKRQCGVNFGNYKKTTIFRRINRRMLLCRKETLASYLELLKSSHREVEELCNDMLIKVTSFFRDPDSFKSMQEKFLPEIIRSKKKVKSPIRVWVPGCSTGEEAYSFAMALTETISSLGKNIEVQIFASDLSETSIQTARSGIYSENSLLELSLERRKRFFSVSNRGFQVNKSLRDMCVFAVHDLCNDPPFSKLDLISCRNVMIYFDSVLQKTIVPIFHYSLNPGGVLILGSSETIGSHVDLFTLQDKKNKIYTKKLSTKKPSASIFPMTSRLDESTCSSESSKILPIVDEKKLFEKVDQFVLTRLVPAGFVINEEFDILQFRGQTTPYVEFPHGTPNLNLLKVIRGELRSEVRMLIHDAKNRGPILGDATIRLKYNGFSKYVRLHVTPISLNETKQCYFLVTVKELLNENNNLKPQSSAEQNSSKEVMPQISEDVSKLERELQETKEQLQSIIEEQDSTNEELKSANEEIISSNEELQSTNEELETAKEELQSSNEELNTVNDELRNRSDELAAINDDLSNLISNIRIAVIILDRNLKVRRFSPAAEKLFRLIPTDIGRPIDDLRPRFNLGDLKALAHEVIDSIQSTKREVRDEDGTWYSLQFKPYLTNDHKIDGVVMTCINIDSMKRALNKSESRLASVIRDSNDAVIVSNLEGAIIEWNLGAKRMYGYTEEEALKLSISTLIPQNKVEEHQKFIANILDGKSIKDFETKRVAKDGKSLDIWLTVTVLNDASGKPIAIATTERDITEKKSMARRYLELYDKSPDMYFSTGLDAKIIDCNMTTVKKLGYSKKDDLLGQQIFSFYYEDSLDLARKAFEDFVKRGHNKNIPLKIKKKDGQATEVLLSENAVRDHHQNIVHSLSTWRDITEIREKERILESERVHRFDKKSAEESSRLKTEFLANVSHEIRTPLTAIVGFCQKIAEDNQNLQNQQSLEIIQRNADHLEHLINDILDFSKIESGKVEYEKSSFSVVEELEDDVLCFKDQCSTKELSLHLHFASSLPSFICSDRVRFRQILFNIVGNAIKFTEKGKIDINVEFIPGSDDEKNLLKVSVVDTGCGISKRDSARLFEPFCQVDSSSTRRLGGTGLGLALSRHLSRALGGDVVLEKSELGLGSTFVITIETGPVGNFELVQNRAKVKLKSSIVSTSRVDSKRLLSMEILVVEDSEDIRSLIKALLNSRGAIVVTANHGKEGVEKASGKLFDLILMDIQMPVMDGYEATKRLRENGYGGPIVALTARLMNEELNKAISAGCEGILAKPVEQEKLFETVEKYKKKEEFDLESED